MDFKTDKSSWALILVMMIIAYFINPWAASSTYLMLATQIIGLPLTLIFLSCIPVVIFCYFIKMIPDIDYSIRLAFVVMIFLLIKHLLN